MITFETLHWKWWIRSDNIVMERGTVLNFSVFAAIFLVSCFSEIGGYPLGSSKVYWRYSHSTGRLSPFRAFRDGRENLVPSGIIYEDNHNGNLIDASKEPKIKGLPHKLFESYENNQVNVLKHELNKEIDVNEFSAKNMQRIDKREIRTDESELRRFDFERAPYNNNEVSDNSFVIQPTKKDYSDEIEHRMYDALVPRRGFSNLEVNGGTVKFPSNMSSEEDTETDEDNND